MCDSLGSSDYENDVSIKEKVGVQSLTSSFANSGSSYGQFLLNVLLDEFLSHRACTSKLYPLVDIITHW